MPVGNPLALHNSLTVGVISALNRTVQDVLPGSPAHLAGLRPGNRSIVLGQNRYVIGGDVVTAINGTDVSSLTEVMKTFLESRPGQLLRLTIFREGERWNSRCLSRTMHGPRR
jgi:S1-C subfamily serine protease